MRLRALALCASVAAALVAAAGAAAAHEAGAVTAGTTALGAAAVSAGTFSSAHIALTAAISGVLTLAAALAVTRSRAAALDCLLIAVVTGAAVFLWRRSANWPQLNDDGLPGFSANDWLAPVAVGIALGVTRAFRPPGDGRGLARARALAVVVALAVNVITI